MLVGVGWLCIGGGGGRGGGRVCAGAGGRGAPNLSVMVGVGVGVGVGAGAEVDADVEATGAGGLPSETWMRCFEDDLWDFEWDFEWWCECECEEPPSANDGDAACLFCLRVSLRRFAALRSSSSAVGGGGRSRKPGRGREPKGGSDGDCSFQSFFMCSCLGSARRSEQGGPRQRVEGRGAHLERVGVVVDHAALLVVFAGIGPDEEEVVGDCEGRRVDALLDAVLETGARGRISFRRGRSCDPACQKVVPSLRASPAGDVPSRSARVLPLWWPVHPLLPVFALPCAIPPSPLMQTQRETGLTRTPWRLLGSLMRM